MHRLAWHFDFHSHKSIRINHDPDVAGMADTLAEAGVDEIITFAKCHTGFAYYPSRVGHPHPRMIGDAFGEVVRACKARGLRVLAYISFGIDGEAGRRHPEWAQVSDPAVGPHLTEDHFIATMAEAGLGADFLLGKASSWEPRKQDFAPHMLVEMQATAEAAGVDEDRFGAY